MEYVNRTVAAAIEEDTGRGDITSDLLIPAELVGRAYMLVKEAGVLAGLPVAQRCFALVDEALQTHILIEDGTPVQPGDNVMQISGNVKSILKAERVALNFLQRLSGIATAAARYVKAVQDLPVEIADTRKTTPLLRAFEKYAVKMGGGRNHRMDLSDAVLIKDNHIAALTAMGLSFNDIISKAKQNLPAGLKLEVETRTLPEVASAVESGVDIIMLDNMKTAEMVQAVKMIAGRAEVEASGNVTLQNVREVAATGVDFISIGALTHSNKALDISLELEPQTFKLF